MRTVWLSWSSGKDSAWALHELKSSSSFRVTGLFTTLNQAFDRVAMHAVPRTLVEAQARAVGLPLHLIPLPWPCTNQEYEKIMARFCQKARDENVEAMAFGDLFLEDVREYRERQLQKAGLAPLFPLWGRPTEPLARKMIKEGLKATLTCIDPGHLHRDFAGRPFDNQLLKDLPAGTDPCGEKGEFHTFVRSGPMFDSPVDICVGETVERDGFVFADIQPC